MSTLAGAPSITSHTDILHLSISLFWKSCNARGFLTMRNNIYNAYTAFQAGI